MGATLTKTRTVMMLVSAATVWGVDLHSGALFERIDEETGRQGMGRPETITLTVEPGDRLN